MFTAAAQGDASVTSLSEAAATTANTGGAVSESAGGGGGGGGGGAAAGSGGGGGVEQVVLKVGGDQLAVTDENKAEYIALMVQHCSVGRMGPQAAAVREVGRVTGAG